MPTTPSAHTPTLRLAHASLAWPDGTVVLDDASLDLGPGRHGLVGDNGSGKTTLLRLIAGDLVVTTGTLEVVGTVGVLPQHLPRATRTRVADLVGVATAYDALRRVEAGSTDQADYDAIGADWDVEARATAGLGALGLDALGLDRPVGTLSGGEAVLVALAGLRLAGHGVTLLDEPTNNLDRHARGRLTEAVRDWPGCLVVVSHDRDLLEEMDRTVELREGRLSTYGGGWTAYAEAVEREQEAARQALRGAEAELRRETRQRREAETRLARSARTGRKDRENSRRPPIVANLVRSRAEGAAGRIRSQGDARLERARQAVETGEERLRDDDRVRIDLPDPQLPSTRVLAELEHAGGTHVVAGPERLAIVGRNGVGKTRLLESLVGRADPAGMVRGRAVTTRLGYLAQRRDDLDESADALAVVGSSAPGRTPQETRAQLARFLLRGDDVRRPVATLSGGERFRVALARLLLADPTPELLVLDEPTNDLDVATAQALVDALEGYRGALIVVSHDDRVLDALGVDARLELTADGLLARAGEE